MQPDEFNLILSLSDSSHAQISTRSSDARVLLIPAQSQGFSLWFALKVVKLNVGTRGSVKTFT